MDLIEDTPRLSIVDYIVFGLSLALSAVIGFYYYFTGDKQGSNKEYLHANKSMGVGPVAVSLMASFMSAITLLGVPAEIYTFGTQFMVINLSYALATPICVYVFLPVFYNLNLTSAYEYLERRFNRAVRLSASIVFMIQMTLYMGIVLYAPALALSAVTGIGKWTSILSVGLICTLYCSAGGIKAVLWTDVFQSVLMFVAVIAVAVRGVILVGGFNAVFEKAFDGKRIEFLNFDPDPTTRHTVWTTAIGGMFIYASLYGVNQTQVQRLQTVSTLKKAQLALILSWPITTFLSLVTCFTGLVMYAYFKGCDPIANGEISKPDQLLPFFMMKIMTSLPGLPGLFIAGIFSGALSSVSSFVNSLAAVTLEDYIKPLRRKPMTEQREALVTKCLALFYGVLCVALTYVAEQMTGILQAALTTFGVVGGPLLALFTLGMCTKKCTSSAALISFFVSLAFGFWIGFGTLAFAPPPMALETTIGECPKMTQPNLYMNTEGRDLLNSSSDALTNITSETFFLYKISYLYYAGLTWAISIVTALIISFVFPSNQPVDDCLISPVFKKLFRSRRDVYAMGKLVHHESEANS